MVTTGARDCSVCRIVGRVEHALFDVGFGDAPHGVAEFLGDELGGVGVDRVGDLRHVALLHEDADDVDAALRHAVGEFLDGDGLWNDHFADNLFFRLGVAMAAHALDAAAERGDRAFANFVRRERRDDREAAAPLLGGDARRLGRRRRTRRTATDTAPHARGFVVVGFLGGTRTARLGGRSFVAAEALLGDLVGFALGFFVVFAAVFLAALARFSRRALGTLGFLAQRADTGIFLGNFAFFRLAEPGIAERVGAPVALLVGERAQHHAGWLGGRRCRRNSGRRCGRGSRRRGPA